MTTMCGRGSKPSKGRNDTTEATYLFSKTLLYNSYAKQSFLPAEIFPANVVKSHPPFQQQVLCFLLASLTNQKIYEDP
jgi:hypothetical protein